MTREDSIVPPPQEDHGRAGRLMEGLAKDLPLLKRGSWHREQWEADTLSDALGRLAAKDHWVGLAETTQGSIALRRATADQLLSTDGTQVDRSTVYELRLWQPEGHLGQGVLAHELRWLNGAGSAMTRVSSTMEAGAEPCWYRRNEYLQHQSSQRSGRDPGVMTCLEVFIEEPAYSNTVFADELFTGRWG